MRRGLIAGVVATAATMGIVGTASAAPPGLEGKGGDPYICDGDEVVIFTGSGRSGWVEDTLYVATSIHFEGTFTPTGGTPQTEVFDKSFGRGPAGEEITCTASFSDSGPEGTFVGESLVTAIKVPGH